MKRLGYVQNDDDDDNDLLQQQQQHILKLDHRFIVSCLLGLTLKLSAEELCKRVLQKANTRMISDLDATPLLDHMFQNDLIQATKLRDIQVCCLF